MQAMEIVKAANPDADEAFCEYVVWERTCYPVGRVTAQDLYRAASRVVRAHRNGLVLCDLCDNAATAGKYTCAPCEAALHPTEERAAIAAASPL